MFSIVAIPSFLICCVLGTVTIWQWKNWELYTGSMLDDMVDSINDKRFVETQRLLLEGIEDSHDKMSKNDYIIRNRITYMVMLLSAGIVFMSSGLVVQWI